jgi:adenylosuccinate lyase
MLQLTCLQASFLQIFDGDHSKVKALDKLVTQKAGFDACYIITSQTYTRKIDVEVLGALSSFGATCDNIGLDIRLLASFKELEEPFEPEQIGSSAMAYKRNPMRSERVCGLGRMLKSTHTNALDTYAAQGLERTLDDSSARRLGLPKAFLLADASLTILDNICSGLIVYPAVIKKRMAAELPFLATENIIMALVKKNVSRQDAHEEIRVLSHEAGTRVKEYAEDNDLLDRIRRTEFFKPILGELDDLVRPETFIGRCPEQVDEFYEQEVSVALQKYVDAGTLKVSEAAELYV